MPSRRYGRFNPRPAPAQRRFDRQARRLPLGAAAGGIWLALRGLASIRMTPPADPYRRYRQVDWRYVGGAAVACGLLWLLAVWWLR